MQMSAEKAEGRTKSVAFSGRDLRKIHV